VEEIIDRLKALIARIAGDSDMLYSARGAINCLLAGWIAPEGGQAWLEYLEEREKEILRETPIGKRADLRDILPFVAFRG